MSPPSVFPVDHAAAKALLVGPLKTEEAQRLEPLGEGNFCFAFRERSRIVRVAKHREAAASLRAEACVLAQIGDHLPLTVPRPLFEAPRACLAFSIHEEVTGEILTRKGWSALSLAARTRAAAELAGFLRTLHSHPIDVAKRCGLGELDPAEAALRSRKDASRFLYPRLAPAIRTQLDDVLERCSAATRSECTVPVLIHCDIAPGHVLFDPTDGRLTGIIDFGDLALGDPARDFIYIYEDFGVEMLEVVITHYQREEASSLLPRVRLWYLFEAVAWTIQMCATGREAEIAEGLSEIVRELSTPGLSRAVTGE
jgi:aminoglycoside 2''-phosphotransferase